MGIIGGIHRRELYILQLLKCSLKQVPNIESCLMQVISYCRGFSVSPPDFALHLYQKIPKKESGAY